MTVTSQISPQVYDNQTSAYGKTEQATYELCIFRKNNLNISVSSSTTNLTHFSFV